MYPLPPTLLRRAAILLYVTDHFLERYSFFLFFIFMAYLVDASDDCRKQAHMERYCPASHRLMVFTR